MKYKWTGIACVFALAVVLATGCGTARNEKEDIAAQTAETGEEAESLEVDPEVMASQDEGAEDYFIDGDGNLVNEEGDSQEVVLDVSEQLTGTHHAMMRIVDYGTIELELDADTAPITVTNFVKLVQEHFYDGLTFHRIIEKYMMQGGDPNGDGTGGSEETIKGEFANNGIENDISHTRGTISMARTSDPDSASSQFFIMQADTPFLDGDYAAFGHVTEGMEIVDAICGDSAPTDDNGTIPKEEQPVIEKIWMID
ncbi:MAG: peptidylprolyl isomerase [Blautia sp.]|nr:peptidylprolyl isomerase [Blautia sp.]MDY5031989.1 peptidylprolyl isomerase [Blautia sp.]